MPIVINCVAFRMQSADLTAAANVGQSISTARTSMIKRNQGYGVNTGNMQFIPSYSLLEDCDANDTSVFMPSISPPTSVSD